MSAVSFCGATYIAVGDDGETVKFREHTGIAEAKECGGEAERDDDDCGKSTAGHGWCISVVGIPARGDKKSGQSLIR